MNAHFILSGMTAIVVMFAIGCADGQRQGKGSNGKGKQILKTQGAGGRVDKTDGSKTTSGTTTLPTTTDSTKQKIIDDGVTALTTGAANPEFKNGTYQLVSTSTFFNFPLPSDFLQALSTTKIEPDQKILATPGSTTFVGSLGTKITQPKRSIGLPLEFTVTPGTTGEPNLRSNNELILTSTVNLKVSVVSIDETIVPANGTVAKISLSALLNTTSEKIDDGKGITASLDGLALENGDVRFIIKVEEALPAPVSSTVYRNFYLTYRLKAAAPAATKTTPAKVMTPEEANIAVVTGNH